ncbi:MAG: hypothetical protein WCF04_03270 [Candidatus Nanopelagicales bacterium]
MPQPRIALIAHDHRKDELIALARDLDRRTAGGPRTGPVLEACGQRAAGW